MNEEVNKAILVLCTGDLYLEKSAGASRMKNFARALAPHCPVYFITFSPPYAIEPEQIKEVDKNFFVLEKPDDTLNGRMKKILIAFRYFRYVKEAYKFSKTLKKDVIFYHYPSTDMALDYFVVYYLIKLKKQKVYYEANEIRRYDSGFNKKVSFFVEPLHFLKRKFALIKYIQSEHLTKHFKGLVCISTNIEKYLHQYNHNTIRIPILANKELIDQSHKVVFKDNETFKICFSGTVGIMKENLGVFFEALSLVDKKFHNFRFDLYGSVVTTDKREIFNELIPRYNLTEKVLYKGMVLQDALQEIYKDYHLLVVPRGFNLQNHYGFSTKLSEYLISGVPVLITNISDNALYLHDGYNGFMVEPDNAQLMADKILEIIETYASFAETMPERAYDTVTKELDYSNFSETLTNFLN